MTMSEHPITRAELRDELDRTLRNYATKADLHESMHQMESRLLRWMAGWTTGGMVAITGLVLAVVRLAGD